MKDMVLLVLLVGSTLWALKAPWIGVMAWTMVSLMSPHVNFGNAAANWPVAIVIALSTLVGMLMTKERANPFAFAPTSLIGEEVKFQAAGTKGDGVRAGHLCAAGIALADQGEGGGEGVGDEDCGVSGMGFPGTARRSAVR